MKLSTNNFSCRFLLNTALLTAIIFCTLSATAQPGNPEQFPDNHWRAYCFNGFSFNTYRGYFDMSEEGFDTRDYYDEADLPSDATGYNGTAISGWFHSVSVKRQGFECGQYTMNVPAFNSFGTVYVDGVPVFSHAWSSGAQDAVWSGFLGPNSTVEYRYRNLFSDSYCTIELEALSGALTIWNGSEDSDWFNPDNWNNGVPDNSIDARITPAGQSPVIADGMAEVKDLRINNTADLTIAAAQELRVYGDFNLLGTLTATEGTLSFESTCPNANQTFSIDEPSSVMNFVKYGQGALELTGSDLEIIGELLISGGSLETGDLITLNSDAEGTACLGPIVDGASISGEITVERYINATSNGWVQLASPVSGQTLSDWSDDFITTGFPGSDYPSFYFNSIRLYDETLVGHKDIGLYNAGDITDPVEALEGYQAYLAAGATTIDVKGNPITGEQDFNVTFTSSEPAEDAGFSDANDGWNLVANPYACTIDWDAPSGWVKTNVDDAIYVWDATIGQYNVYSEGVGVNGGQNLIPSSQAFWVQTNGSNPELRINENAKSLTDAQFKVNEQISVLYLALSGSSGKDEVAFKVVDTEPELSRNAQKLYSSEAVPMLGIQGTAQNDWAIKHVNLSENGADIPLNQAFPAAGTYTISVDLSDYETIGCLFLEDLETGEWTDLRSGDYTFSADEAELHNRFVLHFGAPLEFAVTAVSCHGLADGAIEWNNSSEWLVGIQTADGGSVPELSVDSIGSLAGGQYLINVSSNGLCGLAQQVELFVEEPAVLSVEDSTANATCHNTADGALTVHPVGGTAPYTIEWADGNTSLSRTHLFADIYEYTVTDSKGCSKEASVELLSETIVSASFELSDNELLTGEHAVVFNTSSEADSFTWNPGDGSPNTTVFEPNVQYDQPGEYTLMLIAEKNSCLDVFTQSVIVSEVATSVSEHSANNDVRIWSNGNELIIQPKSKMSLMLTAYNTAGQQLIQSNSVVQASDEWRVPVNTTGVVMVQVMEENTHQIFHQKVYMKR